MTGSVLVVQFQPGDEMELGVLSENDNGAAPARARRIRGTGGLVELIKHTRRGSTSLHHELIRLAEQASENVEVDLDLGIVECDGRKSGLAVPVTAPEVWAAGVTYGRSKQAREAEGDRTAAEFYNRIYEAERPEVFLKDAECRRTVATGESVGIRGDSTWSVPEPELGLVLDADGEIVGFTIGNDISARDIEGANPLYLPQAKIFAGACAVGPAVLVPADGESERSFEVMLRIFDADGARVFSGGTSTAEMNRSFEDLASYVCRYNTLLDGTILLTGTGIVPPDDLSLAEGYRVEVEIPGLGTLSNGVRKLPGGSLYERR